LTFPSTRRYPGVTLQVTAIDAAGNRTTATRQIEIRR
jgi:hypothetical protein